MEDEDAAHRGGSAPGVSGLGLGIEETARRVGHYRWVEQRLFEVLGSWVRAVPDPGTKLRLDDHSRQHAWHASLWESCLPDLGEANAGLVTVPAASGLELALGDLANSGAAPPGPASPPDRDAGLLEMAVGVYRVLLPYQISAYRLHREAASAVSDGPVVRVIGLVLADEVEEWCQGEAIVQAMLCAEEDVARAAAARKSVEAAVLRAGGVAGPFAPRSPGTPAAGSDGSP